MVQIVAPYLVIQKPKHLVLIPSPSMVQYIILQKLIDEQQNLTKHWGEGEAQLLL